VVEERLLSGALYVNHLGNLGQDQLDVRLVRRPEIEFVIVFWPYLADKSGSDDSNEKAFRGFLCHLSNLIIL
jgi:hypothetical protein